jgi:hypothetical protein
MMILFVAKTHGINEEAGLHMMILFVAKTHGIYDEKVLYRHPESDVIFTT